MWKVKASVDFRRHPVYEYSRIGRQVENFKNSLLAKRVICACFNFA